jgi:hypothetical protein
MKNKKNVSSEDAPVFSCRPERYTIEQKIESVLYLSKRFTAKEIGKKMDLVDKQINIAFDTKNTSALENLHAMRNMFAAARWKRTWPKDDDEGWKCFLK